MANSADPDQLASLEANWSGSTLFAKKGISGFSRTRVNIFKHIQDMYLQHYNIIKWDSEECQLTYEVCLFTFLDHPCGIQSKVTVVSCIICKAI